MVYTNGIHSRDRKGRNAMRWQSEEKKDSTEKKNNNHREMQTSSELRQIFCSSSIVQFIDGYLSNNK